MDLIEVEKDETASMHFKFPPAPHSENNLRSKPYI